MSFCFQQQVSPDYELDFGVKMYLDQFIEPRQRFQAIAQSFYHAGRIPSLLVLHTSLTITDHFRCRVNWLFQSKILRRIDQWLVLEYHTRPHQEHRHRRRRRQGCHPLIKRHLLQWILEETIQRKRHHRQAILLRSQRSRTNPIHDDHQQLLLFRIERVGFENFAFAIQGIIVHWNGTIWTSILSGFVSSIFRGKNTRCTLCCRTKWMVWTICCAPSTVQLSNGPNGWWTKLRSRSHCRVSNSRMKFIWMRFCKMWVQPRRLQLSISCNCFSSAVGTQEIVHDASIFASIVSRCRHSRSAPGVAYSAKDRHLRQREGQHCLRSHSSQFGQQIWRWHRVHCGSAFLVFDRRRTNRNFVVLGQSGGSSHIQLLNDVML